PLWQADGGLKAIKQEPESPVGVGTRLTEERTFMGHTFEDVSEVTEFEPNSRYTRTNAGTNAPVRGGTLTFEAVPEGTQVASCVDIAASGLFGIAEPVLAGILEKGFADGLAKAKALLEQRVADPAR